MGREKERHIQRGLEREVGGRSERERHTERARVIERERELCRE